MRTDTSKLRQFEDAIGKETRLSVNSYKSACNAVARHRQNKWQYSPFDRNLRFPAAWIVNFSTVQGSELAGNCKSRSEGVGDKIENLTVR